MAHAMTRRSTLSILAAQAAIPAARAKQAPVAPVAVSRCRTYSASELVPVLESMFDRLGGLGRIVKGKTVAIKLNMNGGPTVRLGHLALGDTHWPHPNLICATMHLMERAGVRRIWLVEGATAPKTAPFEEHVLEANWDPQDFYSAARRVEFENTNYLGPAKQFSRMRVPEGALIYPAYDMNHSYAGCDVFVSIAKYKDHPTTGVTTVMKNLFGLPPLMVYGNGAGKHQDNDMVTNSRMNMLHMGKGQPAYGALPELDPSSPRDDRYRVPRIVAELCAARPVHLAIMDGVKTMAGAQTPDPLCTPVSPGVLMAGTNVVNTAAAAVTAMNYDPRAPKGTVPFEDCDNKLLLAEQLGVGSCDLRRIEVVGAAISDIMFDFRSLREKRKARLKEMFPDGTRYNQFGRRDG